MANLDVAATMDDRFEAFIIDYDRAAKELGVNESHAGLEYEDLSGMGTAEVHGMK